LYTQGCFSNKARFYLSAGLEIRIRFEYTIGMAKTSLRTIRFAPHELEKISLYIKANPSFESLSSLGRIAIMEFIQKQQILELHPLPSTKTERTKFLWDYDLSDAQVHEILNHSSMAEKKWLIGRLLETLRPPEIFDYLSVSQIKAALPHVRINNKTKQHWQEAISLWSPKKPQS
jgi:hypothetical protein